MKQTAILLYYFAYIHTSRRHAQLSVYSVRLSVVCKGNYEFVGEDGETVLENPTATADKEFTVGAGSSGNNGGGIGGIGGIEDIENLLKELPLSRFRLCSTPLLSWLSLS